MTAEDLIRVKVEEATSYQEIDEQRLFVRFSVAGGRFWFSGYFLPRLESVLSAWDVWKNNPTSEADAIDSLTVEAVPVSDVDPERLARFRVEKQGANMPVKSTKTATVEDSATIAAKGPKTPENAPFWQQFLFDFTKPQPVPPGLVFRDGVAVASRQTLTMVAGEEKSGKSYNLALMIAAAVGGRDCFGYSALQPLRAVAIETEMSGDEAAARYRGAFNAAGIQTNSSPQNLAVLRLRGCDPRQKQEVLRDVVEDVRPDVVFIDGLLDFVADFNDPAQATEVVEGLLQICDSYNCGVVVTIHTNPEYNGRAKALGHVGSALSRRDSCFLLSKRNGPIIQVSFRHGRGGGFPPFSFTIGSDGTPQLIAKSQQQAGEGQQEQKADKGPAPATLKLLEVMEPGREYKRTELVKMLQPFNISEQNTDKYLNKGVQDGIFQKKGRGIYSVPQQSGEDDL